MDNILMHFKGEEEFIKRIEERCDQVENRQSMFLTEFLTPYQVSMILSIVNGKEGLQVQFFGGIVHSEMVRAIIAPDYYEIEEEDFQICVMEIRYPGRFEKIRHQDVLGALMSLGMKRELFGDIVIDENAYVACDKKVERLLYDELTQIRHSPVHVQQAAKLIESNQEFIIRRYFVKSLRLDILLSHFYNQSRSSVNKAIQAGFVKVNHKIVVENSFLCNNNDVISYQKHGRVKLVDTGQVTKGNNHVIEGHFYK